MPWPTTSRHERGYGTAWSKLRLRILERDMRRCQPCIKKGIVHPGNEVDHIVPKAKGGTDDEDNLQAIGSECHKAKTLRDEGKRLKPRVMADGWPADEC